MAALKVNDRVILVHPQDGNVLGVIGKVNKVKSTVDLIPDDGFEQNGDNWTTSAYENLKTLVEIPQRFYKTDAPLPDHCFLPNDDPVTLAGFAGKVTEKMRGWEGWAYRIKITKDGKATKIEVYEDASGGPLRLEAHGADKQVVADFKAACEAWVDHYRMLGPKRGDTEGYEVWQGWVFEVSQNLKKRPANFPIALALVPQPWDFTFET